MTGELWILMGTAVSVSLVHTIAGPDHYLPFIGLARARGWNVRTTLFWTALCGMAHVASSVILSFLGAAMGWSLDALLGIESVRGGIAGWAMLVFGSAYLAWGIWQATRNRNHRHFESDPDGTMYVFEHRHGQVVKPADRHRLTPWVLFLIFVLGPCEPMIPLLTLPAVTSSWWTMGLLIMVYSICTLAVMICMVIGCYSGLKLFRFRLLEKYMHTLGGVAIFVCGMGMVFMNW